MRKENNQYRKKTKRKSKSKIFNVLLIIILILGAGIGFLVVANDLIDSIDNDKSSENNGDYIPDNIENKIIEIFNLEDNENFIAEFKDFLKKLLGRE